MKKDRFLGYLDALLERAENDEFREDEVAYILGCIIEKAEQLEDGGTKYNPPYCPYYPYQWWNTTIGLDTTAKRSYNVNDWEITSLTNGDFEVKYK